MQLCGQDPLSFSLTSKGEKVSLGGFPRMFVGSSRVILEPTGLQIQR